MKIDKGFILMAFIFVFALCFIQFTSAELFKFDNIKSYDAVNKEVTITNTFGLGGDIAKIKLNTPLNVLTGYGGEFKVFEFTTTNYKDYVNAFEKIQTYNKFDLTKEISREIKYKVKSYEDYNVNDYKEVCKIGKGNTTETCENVIIGTHKEQREVWLPLEKSDFKDGEIITIGGFAWVNKYERVEWIPTFYGVKINEWASWTAGLETQLLYAYAFDEGSGTKGQENVSKTNNLTYSYGEVNRLGYGLTCKLGNCINITTGGNVVSGVNVGIVGTQARSVNVWVYNPTGGQVGIVNWGGTSSGQWFGLGTASSTFLSIAYNDEHQYTGLTIPADTWTMMTLIYNGTSFIAYINDGTGSVYTSAINTANSVLSLNGVGSVGGGTFAIDNLFIWNRTLTTQEISDLYNGGVGLVYKNYNVLPTPQVTLNSPINYYNTSNPSITFNVTATDEQAITNVTLYIDGVLNQTDTSGVNGTYIFTKTLSENLHNWSILAYNNNSQSTQLVTRTFWINTTPSVTLTAPDNYANLTYNNIKFNSSVLSVYNIANVTFYLNGTANQTDTSGVNGTYVFSKYLTDNYYSWSIKACSSLGGCNQSVTRFLTIDSTSPTINISYPTNTTYTTTGLITADNVSIWFNWTAIDTNRELCWYSKDNGATNTTITCNANASFYSTYGTKTLIAWVNDSFGLLTASRVTATWSYGLFENSRTTPTTAIEGITKTFTLNLTLTANTPITSAYLNYNGTRYSTSINAGTYTIITTTIPIPLVTADGSVTIFWELSGGVNTSSSSMSVSNIAIDDCTINTIPIYNFTIVDEILQTKLTNTNASLNLQIYPTSSATEIINYTHQYDAINSFAVCINNSFAVGDSFTIDAEVQYIADNHSSEFYHIQKENLSSTYYRNITLYDLDTTNSQIFKIVYRDSTYIAIEDALIQIKRKYISEGVFKVSEIPITDYNGETFASLQTDNVVYTFVVIKNGVILDTFSNLFVKCNNILIEDCTISLNSISPYVVPEDFTIGDDFNFDITYNRTTRLLSASFNIPSGNSSTIILNSTLTDNIGTIVACSDTLTSSSGTLSCTIPNGIGNLSVVAYVYKDNVLQGYSIANNKQSARDIYGGSLVFLLLFLYLTLIGISIGDNPMITGIFLVIGVILGIALNLVNGSFIGRSATILWLVIAVVIVLVKGGKRT